MLKRAYILLALSCFVFSSAQNEIEVGSQDIETPSYLILADIGLGVGWPGYQLYNAHISLQKDVFAVAFKGSITELGPYISIAGRYYTPIPIPVPTFASIGAGVFGDKPTFFASLGGHIPLGLSDFRLTLEGGASYVNILDRNQILPYASLSLGYVFSIDQAPISKEEREQREIERFRPKGCEPKEPDPGAISDAFSKALDKEIKEAKVVYAGVYKSPNYSYRITDKTVEGNQGRLKVSFSISATEVASGNSVSASGTLNARFRWNGCAWTFSGYSID